MKKDCFYRIGVKALIEDREGKFLLIKEKDGWELPGGGLEHGEDAHTGLAREILEEMGLKVLTIEQSPSYFTTTQHRKGEYWVANIIYKTTLEHLKFIPSAECMEYRFFDKAEAMKVDLFPNVKAFVDLLS